MPRHRECGKWKSLKRWSRTMCSYRYVRYLLVVKLPTCLFDISRPSHIAHRDHPPSSPWIYNDLLTLPIRTIHLPHPLLRWWRHSEVDQQNAGSAVTQAGQCRLFLYSRSGGVMMLACVCVRVRVCVCVCFVCCVVCVFSICCFACWYTSLPHSRFCEEVKLRLSNVAVQ